MLSNVLTAAAPAGSGFQSIIFLVVILIAFYFFLIRPEKKKKQQLQEMRSSLTVGDEIVTIGGMMGKIVQSTEDTVTFETGEDRVRIQVTKWAISTNVREEQKKAQMANSNASKKKAKTTGEDNSVDGQ